MNAIDAQPSLRTAVIGVGYLGRFHAQKYAQLPGTQLIGVVDANLETAARVAAELQVNAFNHYTELLNRVDAVSIAVPTPLHFEIARTFLERGVHVLVEKPITTTLADAESLVELAKRKRCVLQVG